MGRVRAPAGVDVAIIPDETTDSAVTGHDGPAHEEEFSLVARARRPILIGVTRKAIAAGRDPKADGVPGLEEPYELRSEFVPQAQN